MKNVTVKVIIATCACFLLALGFGKMAEKSGSKDYWDQVSEVYSMKNGKKFSSSTVAGRLDSSGLTEIQINSRSSDIKIEKSDDDQIEFIYKGFLSDSKIVLDEKSSYKIEGNRVVFDFDHIYQNKINEEANWANFFKFNIDFGSDGLVLRIPKSIKNLRIDSVSSGIKITDISLDELDIKTISGDLRLKNSNVKKISHESVSGDLKIDGDIRQIKSKTISGNLRLESVSLTPEIKFSTTSGDLKASFKSTPDLNIDFNTTSGELNFDRQFTQLKVDGSVKAFRLGKGISHLEVSSVSGNIDILKIQAD